MSASPFYPKSYGKSSKLTEAQKQLNDAIIKIKDTPDFFQNLKNIIDALSEDQRVEIIDYLKSKGS